MVGRRQQLRHRSLFIFIQMVEQQQRFQNLVHRFLKCTLVCARSLEINDSISNRKLKSKHILVM